MDVLLPSAAGFADGVPAVDNRAPPAARVLMMLCHLDAELETLRINETALVRRLEQARRDARAAHEEFRAQEIHVLFVESSPRYMAPPDALRRLRGWLEGASQRCRELAARAESATSEAERKFDLIHRRMKANGSRVLSLGDVGSLASLPVMEGKALLYRELAGLSAVPILVDSGDPNDFVRIVERTSAAITACSDPVAITVSETTGTVSVFKGGRMTTDIHRPSASPTLVT